MATDLNNRIAIVVAYSFPPDAGSGAIRNGKLLRHLPSYGWRLRVVTTRSDDRQIDEEADDRFGEQIRVIRTRCFYTHQFLVSLKNFVTFSWLRRSSRAGEFKRLSATVDGAVKNSRPASGSRGSKAFIEDVLAIPDKYVGWLPFAVWGGARSMCRERADVIYAIGKPWTGFFVGYLLKLLFRKPLVIDFMDPWRASTWAPSKGRCLDAVQDQLERFIVKRADFVIANTPELADDFVERLGVAKERIRVVTCGYDPNDVSEAVSEDNAQPTQRFTVTHTGTFYKQRTPLHFLKAVKLLFDEGRLPKDAIRINLIGNMPVVDPELELLLADPAIAQAVHCQSWVPHAEALQCLGTSDALLLVQPDTRLQIPAKLYEYAAFRRPILALADAGGAVDNLMSREGWGPAVRYDDVEMIAKELESLYRAYCDGRHSSHAAASGVEAYSYPALAKRLGQVFESLTEHSATAKTITERVAV